MAKPTPTPWPDTLLIREIRAGGRRRERAWSYIYKAWFGAFLGAVRQTNGKAAEEDVIAVLGKVCMSVEKQVCKPDFALREATLCTYIAAAVINAYKRWMGKNTPPPTVEFDPQTHQAGHYDPMDDDDVTNEVLDQILAQLGEPCRTILLMKAQGYKNREIAQALGMAEQTIKNKKGDCEDNLKNLTKDL